MRRRRGGCDEVFKALDVVDVLSWSAQVPLCATGRHRKHDTEKGVSDVLGPGHRQGLHGKRRPSARMQEKRRQASLTCSAKRKSPVRKRLAAQSNLRRASLVS
jgi:hypothetical protein